MPLKSAHRPFLAVAIWSVGIGMATFIAVANPSTAFILLVPTYALVTATLLWSGGTPIRMIVVAWVALTSLVIGLGAGEQLILALTFAFANSFQAVTAYLLLCRREWWPGNWPTMHEALGADGHNQPSSSLVPIRTQLSGQIGTLTGDGPIAALIVEIDNLNPVADALGHSVREETLEIIARRVRDYVRPEDIVARLGGDEIAIVLSDVRSRTAIEDFARLVFAAVNTPIELGAMELRITARIGVAPSGDVIDDGGELLRRAGVALNAVKFEKSGFYKVYEAQMDASLRRRQEIVRGLFLAVGEETFEVHYQPVVHLAINEVIAFEALVRWRHATLGYISPAEFIPIAEELGLIAAIGDLVLRQACTDAAGWPDEVKVSVNFSRAQLDVPDAKSRIQAILKQTGFPARRLQLEITETTAMANPDRAILLLDELRALGLEIAIDDFGTGYSSLGCLRNCSFDVLKIDRAFIQDLATSLEARAILTMIVKLANTLGMHTIAEGVETAEQLAIVKEEGCGAVQGFYFSPAKPACEIFTFLGGQHNESSRTQTA